MPADIIDGRKISRDIRAELRQRLEVMAPDNLVPGLAMVLVGEDPASLTYVSGKARACAELKIHSETVRLPQDTTMSRVLSAVKELNERENIHGLLVQLPLPDHLAPGPVAEAISPLKDVDGLHPVNIGRLAAGQPLFVPCTPGGVQQMLLRTGNDPQGKDVVILGRSAIVGRPLANLLMTKGPGGNATVTICHTVTHDIAAHARRADILIVAIGKPQVVDEKMIKPGAVVIDVGIHRIADQKTARGYRLVGDVDFASVSKLASWISPVPGGVGQLTVTMLMANTVRAAQLARAGPNAALDALEDISP